MPAGQLAGSVGIPSVLYHSPRTGSASCFLHASAQNVADLGVLEDRTGCTRAICACTRTAASLVTFG
eukprot:scaffold142940_cov14-Tisochrysis_lutea.AAC.1